MNYSSSEGNCRHFESDCKLNFFPTLGKHWVFHVNHHFKNNFEIFFSSELLFHIQNKIS
jgi:hypothetical protein